MNSSNNSANPIVKISTKIFKSKILLNKIFEMKPLKKIKFKQKNNPMMNINKIDLNINSYFSSLLLILGTIAIIPLGILNPIMEVNKEEENNTWDQKPISL